MTLIGRLGVAVWRHFFIENWKGTEGASPWARVTVMAVHLYMYLLFVGMAIQFLTEIGGIL